MGDVDARLLRVAQRLSRERVQARGGLLRAAPVPVGGRVEAVELLGGRDHLGEGRRGGPPSLRAARPLVRLPGREAPRVTEPSCRSEERGPVHRGATLAGVGLEPQDANRVGRAGRSREREQPDPEGAPLRHRAVRSHDRAHEVDGTGPALVAAVARHERGARGEAVLPAREHRQPGAPGGFGRCGVHGLGALARRRPVQAHPELGAREDPGDLGFGSGLHEPECTPSRHGLGPPFGGTLAGSPSRGPGARSGRYEAPADLRGVPDVPGGLSSRGCGCPPMDLKGWEFDERL